MYETFLKPILFRFDPEVMHDTFTAIGRALGSNPCTRRIVASICCYRHPSLRTRVAGIDFENPIGLGAGFDKDARLLNIMPSVGFGFMEVGAVTRYPYEGNAGRRLVRLPKDKALIVYYGLKNRGATAIEKDMARARLRIPTGVNIAKTNRADIKGAASVEDYVESCKLLAPHFSYVTLNISCPNAQDGCTFQDPQMLASLLSALREKVSFDRPVFLKISSHLPLAEVDAILAVAEQYPFITGFVVANLAKDRGILHLSSPQERLDLLPQGGISGAPMRALATEMVRHIYRKTGGKYVLIGLGGVFTAEDAYEKIKAGASLVQIVTGLVYRGPSVVKKINRGLVRLLANDGYATVADAVGKEAGAA